MTEAPKLLPCPFCGGENVRVDIGLMEFVDGEVTCADCGGNCGNHPTKAAAIAAWNRRHDAAVSAARKEGDKLADAVARFRKTRETQMRTADFHGEGCKCWRCVEDAMIAALQEWEASK